MSKHITLRDDIITSLDEIREQLKAKGKKNSYSDAIDLIRTHKKVKE